MGTKKKAPQKPNQNLSTKTWLSVKELSEYLGISKETVYRLLDKKQIPSRRIGRLHRFYKVEIDKWMLKH
jgi:excisionase family DNA binding protein